MTRFRRFLPIVAALIGVAMLGLPTAAYAELFELRVSNTGSGGPFTTYYSNDGGATFYTDPGFVTPVVGQIKVDGLSIHASATEFQAVKKSTLDLMVSGTQTGKVYDIFVEASVTDVPTGPPPQLLSWKFSSSTDIGALIERAEGWVDTTNVIFASGSKAVDTGLLTAPAQGSKVFSATPPYSWTERYTLTGLGVLGDQVSGDNNESIIAPAPAGLLLSLSGMPVLGIGAWIRRRRTRTKA